MEVTAESTVMLGRESFSVGLQKSPVPVQQPQPAALPALRLAYTTDGTAVYKPMTASSPPQYQTLGGGTPGGNSATGGGEGIQQAIVPHAVNTDNSGELPLKRKRGRPRKYGPSGTMAHALFPASQGAGGIPASSVGSGTLGSTGSAETAKRAKGRPPSSSKKQQMAALGSAGIGFIPHVITVKAGEDVSSKIISFSQNGPRAVCILSANGAISNVTLRQAATSGGTVTYEGRFEILSLSGSSLLSLSGGQRSRTGGLSISLAGPDGRVLGGGVAGPLMAASPVQVVVGSFIAEGKKESKPTSPSDPVSAPGKLAPSGPSGPSSSPSRGTHSESSGGPGSPPNQITGNCNNTNQQGMSSMLWK